MSCGCNVYGDHNDDEEARDKQARVIVFCHCGSEHLNTQEHDTEKPQNNDGENEIICIIIGEKIKSIAQRYKETQSISYGPAYYEYAVFCKNYGCS